MSLLLNWLLKYVITSISSPMHSGAFSLESKFQNSLSIFRMAIQWRRRNGNTTNPNLYSDGTFMMKPNICDVSMHNGSLQINFKPKKKPIGEKTVRKKGTFEQIFVNLLALIKPNGLVASQLKCAHYNIHIVLAETELTNIKDRKAITFEGLNRLKICYSIFTYQRFVRINPIIGW